MLGILKRLEANGKHLLGLINDVLDLSKIEAGQLVLDLSDYSHAGHCPDRPQHAGAAGGRQRSSRSRSSSPTRLPIGRGDGRRLTQVLINLVGNAIKFTDAGEVAHQGRSANGSFHVSVRDTGPGIPLPIRPGCSRSSSRPTMPSPRRRAAPAWGSPYRSASLRCTAARSGSSRSSAKGRLFSSISPSGRSAGTGIA